MSEVFSHPIRAATVKETPQEHLIVVDGPARAALAAAFGLPGIPALQGHFKLVHEQGGVIAATLRLKAKVTQTCVITLEPFQARLDETAALRFVPAREILEGEELEIDPETLEGPDEIPYSGESIDLGAALAEQLALSLDPYPRRPGAKLPEGLEDAAENPFAALAARIAPQKPS